MKIIDRLNEDRIHISFEVFPPKTDAGFDKVMDATDRIAKLNPSYISVTYGAGGGTSKNTARIASHIKDDLGVLSLAHLTCASSTKEEVRGVIDNLRQLGIENILALRGDIPEGMAFPTEDRFHYAWELVEEIRAAVHSVVERTPPELVGDIYENGMVMTGGGAMLHGLDKHMSAKLKMPVGLAENPVECVAIGTGRSFEYISQLVGGFITSSPHKN